MSPAPPRIPEPAGGRPGNRLALGLVALLAACGGSQESTYRREFPAFATLVSIEVRGTEPAAAARAVDAVEDALRPLDRDWYAWGDGELGRANAALGAGRCAPVSPDLAALIGRAETYRQLSGGLFDPGVGDLVHRWGFDRAETVGSAEPPDGAELAWIRAGHGRFADLRNTGGELCSALPLTIDLGGMAKGTALRRAGAVLRAAGVHTALVSIGGSSLLALGAPAGRPWRIGIRDPRSTGILATVPLQPGESLDTSGDYERAYVREGRRYHHILDPRTGEPATGAASVTVIAADPELADAASTALLVGGPARFDELRQAFGLRAALLVTPAGRILASPAMESRLRAANDGRLPGNLAASLAARPARP